MRKPIAVALTDTHLKEDNLQVNISIFEQTIQYCKNNDIDTFFHFGDIFNSRKSQSQELLVDGFDHILNLLDAAGIQMITIPGNHDKVHYSSVKSFLHPYRHHPSFTLIDTYYKFEIVDRVMCHLIPFFSNDVYLSVLSQCEYEQGYEHILFTHIGVEGARMNNGQLVKGISRSSFANFSKVYIGHYHDKQSFGIFDYIGSSLQHNFGESTEKGLTLIYDDLSFKTLELIFPRYYKIEADVRLLTPEYVNEVRKEKQLSGDFIRVVLIGDEAEVKAFNKQSLQNAGVSVELKENRLSKEEISTRVIPFNSNSINEAYVEFCERNSLDIVAGQKYLDQITQANV